MTPAHDLFGALYRDATGQTDQNTATWMIAHHTHMEMIGIQEPRD